MMCQTIAGRSGTASRVPKWSGYDLSPSRPLASKASEQPRKSLWHNANEEHRHEQESDGGRQRTPNTIEAAIDAAQRDAGQDRAQQRIGASDDDHGERAPEKAISKKRRNRN